MSLNEAIVEDAALEWFGEQSCVAQSLTPTLSRGERGQEHGPHLAPGEHARGTLTPALSHRERESFGEVVQIRFAPTLIPAFSHGEKEKREAIWRLNPAIPQARTLATLRDTLLPKLLSGELSVHNPSHSYSDSML